MTKSILKINKYGEMFWYINDQLHRIDGPAYCWNDGRKSWWLKGKFIRRFSYD